MPDFYRLVNTNDPAVDATSEIVLAKDDDGKPSKVVSTGIPAQLTADDRKAVEAMGYELEAVSKEDAEKAQARGGVGGDIAGSAPVLGAQRSKDNDK